METEKGQGRKMSEGGKTQLAGGGDEAKELQESGEKQKVRRTRIGKVTKGRWKRQREGREEV